MKGSAKWFVVATALIPALALAASWWNNDWKFRKEISFENDLGDRFNGTGNYDLTSPLPVWRSCPARPAGPPYSA